MRITLYDLTGGMLHRLTAAAFASGLVLCAATVQQVRAASTIVDAFGFESPTFVNGDLKSQNGWNKTAGTSTGVVESSIAYTGTRAVQVTRATLSDDYWAVVKGGYPTGRFVTIDWDMAVNQTFTTGVGPFFGVTAWDYQQNGSGSPPPGVGLLGTLGVDAATGEVLYQAATTGFITPAVNPNNTPATVTFSAWNHFRIVLDYTNHKYDIFLGGVKLGLGSSIGFVDQNNAVGGLQDFTDADISTFAAGADSASSAATGTAYIDNFIVRDGLLGDYDQSGAVDAADYTVWKQAFGSTVATAGNGADGNGNGKVDAADYTVWRDHLGSSLFSGSGSGALSTAAVPEPGALMLAALGGMALAAAWKRQT
jgi:hypothetical protein